MFGVDLLVVFNVMLWFITPKVVRRKAQIDFEFLLKFI